MARIDCISDALISTKIAPFLAETLTSSQLVKNLVSGCSAEVIAFPILKDNSGETLSIVTCILIFALGSFKVYIICAGSYFIVAFWTVPNSHHYPIKFYRSTFRASSLFLQDSVNRSISLPKGGTIFYTQPFKSGYFVFISTNQDQSIPLISL